VWIAALNPEARDQDPAWHPWGGVTSSAEMKVGTSPTKLLDKTFWNPRPEIDLASRAVSDESSSFRLFFKPPKLKIFYLAGPSKAKRYQLESKSLKCMQNTAGPT
jgi:hypothetical protein